MKKGIGKTAVATERRIRIGISSCLLGEKVRYDGNHKRDVYIAETLGRVFEFVPVCPEVGIGLGVPRLPIHLVGSSAAPRAVGVANPDRDVTHKLAAYGERQARRLDDISGYVFKSKSPSCGLQGVKLNARQGNGRGIYAAALVSACPLLPVEEEGRLTDPLLRENFLERVFGYRRWQDLVASGLSTAKLAEFHAQHRFTLMAHRPDAYRALNRLVAGTDKRNLKDFSQKYVHQFMQALKYPATRKRHVHVLRHSVSYLKKHLKAADKVELWEAIDVYGLGQVPWLVPVTLLKHHFRHFPDPHVARQFYLYPHPDEFMLGNVS